MFGLGLLMAQYTITGFDASAHLAEETNNASRMAAVGMYMSVVASVVFGWILLLAVTFAIPSTEGALENIGVVVPWIWAESMSQNWSEALLFICVVAQFFCVTASVTSASRMMFAFSRDRAVPGHQLWSKVASEPRAAHTPSGRSSCSRALLMVPAIWNYLVGYAAGTAIAVIGLYIAFILPVILRFRMGDAFEPGAWSLAGTTSGSTRSRSAGSALITILFVFPLYKAGLPWEDDFSWELTNYTILWFVGIGARLRRLVGALGKRWFKGPVRQGTEEELERIEQQLGRPAGAPTTAA